MKRQIVAFLIAVAASLPSIAAAGIWVNGVYYSKGVECDVTGGGFGNVQKNPIWLGCDINVPAGSTQIVGLALCENPGGNMPPGLQPAAITVSFGTVAQVDPNQVLKNGKVYMPLVALVPGDILSQLVSACPNPNYTVTDFVPCSFDSTLTVTDSLGNTVTQKYSCTMDQCLTLGFNKTTGLPEKRQYTCTVVQ